MIDAAFEWSDKFLILVGIVTFGRMVWSWSAPFFVRLGSSWISPDRWRSARLEARLESLLRLKASPASGIADMILAVAMAGLGLGMAAMYIFAVRFAVDPSKAANPWFTIMLFALTGIGLWRASAIAEDLRNIDRVIARLQERLAIRSPGIPSIAGSGQD